VAVAPELSLTPSFWQETYGRRQLTALCRDTDLGRDANRLAQCLGRMSWQHVSNKNIQACFGAYSDPGVGSRTDVNVV